MSDENLLYIFYKFENEGVTQEQLLQVQSPIGIEMGAETKEEIANNT
ncbi:hypothetical protein [Neobacillus sp. FSL H8-0543]